MSGGSMEYVYYRINEAAERIQRELANLELQRRSGVKPHEPSKYYTEKHPDYPAFASGEALRDAVIERMREAVKCCRRAAIYAERVEWLTSDDDGDEDFLLRLDEDLAECDAHGGVQ